MIEMRVLTADNWMLWRELRLQALAEAPQAFGSRLADWQGDGDALIEAVTLWATRAGFEALRLAVTPANEYALKLYYRNGFRPTGDPGDVTDDGHREIVMDRRLLGTRHRPGH
ncbi:GNAT family N-acetyltransferase [Nocardia sp. N2S4-5]|uniref:GNAT family N-acetyltransferase n=1 Tax=Nocardia sp. N2S4-5 TaxID=3351565 RepID=UPI0037CF8207